MSITLADQYDVLLLDLDGTVYLGGQVIDHVPAALAEAGRRGARSVYVTNNASRPPAEVAQTLIGMGMAAAPEDVLTSPEAAAAMLAQTHPAGSAVLVIGAQWLCDAVEQVGLRPVRTADENPVAVVQGHNPDTGWRQLAEAAIVLRDPAHDWVATNTDTTLPTDRGLLPGNGSMVGALRIATGRTPRVAGKPARPLLDEAVRRVQAERPLVVGDRLDTDLEAAVTAGLPSLMVLTGVSTAADLVAAPLSQQPRFVSFDLRGLVDPEKVVDLTAESAVWSVSPSGAGAVVLLGDPEDGDLADLQALAALRAASLQHDGIRSVKAGGPRAVAALERLGLATS